MQKILKFSVFVFLSVYVFLQTKEKPIVSTNDILLENVEALAHKEESEIVSCRLSGDYICPDNGMKVGKVYMGYNLEFDEETY